MARGMKQQRKPPPAPDHITIVDEPGMAERFQRGLQRALNTPPQPRGKLAGKAKKQAGDKAGSGKDPFAVLDRHSSFGMAATNLVAIAAGRDFPDKRSSSCIGARSGFLDSHTWIHAQPGCRYPLI